jgi:hypothetical protein
LLTGGLAVGKTAVAQEVAAAAAECGLRVAAIDLDWLGWSSGASSGIDELIGRNLAGVAANYLATGVDNLVLARALVNPASLPATTSALPGWDLVVVRLEASRSAQERRLRARDSGSDLESHLARIDDFIERTRAVLPDAPVIVNEGRSLRDVALEVMRIAGWSAEEQAG